MATAAILLVAARYQGDTPPADMLASFRDAAKSLRGGAHFEGRTAAREWLEDPSFSSSQLRDLSAVYRSLIDRAASAAIDWDEESAFLLEAMGVGGPWVMPLGIADALTGLLDIPQGAECACAFGGTVAIAWSLARRGPMRLYLGEPDLARLVAMLAAASGRPLTVDRRNPIDGTFMPSDSEFLRLERRSPVEKVDFLITVPPIGMKVRDHEGKKPVAVEALQVELLRGRARKAFFTILPDGLLFREGPRDVALRQQLVKSAAICVVSLPAGLWGRFSGVSASLVRVEPSPSSTVRFINARTMATQSVGRVQDRLVAQHLSEWPQIIADPSRSVGVRVEEVAANRFVLLPDRYVRSPETAAIEDALERGPVVTLEEVATIERSKAPRPLLDDNVPSALICLEIAPSDIRDGIVTKPRRRVQFSEEESRRARNVAVQPGDILVSIKGNVGIVGQVPDMELHYSHATGEPWIISQSLAIVRLRPNAAIATAELLAAILTAPWARKGLESLSGGTAINTLPMSALRAFAIPVPPPGEGAKAVAEMRRIAEMREDIERRLQGVSERREALWQRLWKIDLEKGTTAAA